MDTNTLINVVITGLAMSLLGSFLYSLLARETSRKFVRLREKWERIANKLNDNPELIVETKLEIIYYNTRYIGFLTLSVLFLIFLFYAPRFAQLYFAISSLLLSLFALRDLIKVVNLRNIVKSTERDRKLRSIIE